eukprot:179189_1
MCINKHQYLFLSQLPFNKQKQHSKVNKHINKQTEQDDMKKVLACGMMAALLSTTHAGRKHHGPKHHTRKHYRPARRLQLDQVHETQDVVFNYESEPHNMGSSEFIAFASFKHNEHGKCNNDKIGVYFDIDVLDVLPQEIPDMESANNLHNTDDCTTPSPTVATLCCGEELEINYKDFITRKHHRQDTKFNHLWLNYEPVGHGPIGVYDVPHWDFHFYLIDSETREESNPAECLSDLCRDGDDNLLNAHVDCDVLARCEQEESDSAYWPGGNDGDWACFACFPGMGYHCASVSAASELFAQTTTFDDTMFFTRWDGELNSFEPMITVESFKVLNEGLKGEKSVYFETPERFHSGKGCYPTKFTYGCGQETEFGDDKC